VIFTSFVTFIILSTDFLIHSQIFVGSRESCGLGEGAEIGYFWCKMGIGRIFFFLVLYFIKDNKWDIDATDFDRNAAIARAARWDGHGSAARKGGRPRQS